MQINPPNYTASYFIKKFKAIPAKFWCTNEFTKGVQHCALGHCGCVGTYISYEGMSLRDLFHKNEKTNDGITKINDGHTLQFKQKTPRARVLAALRSIKGSA